VAAYATISDLENAGLPPGAISGLDYVVINSALERASRIADTYLRDRYTLPLVAPFDPALVDAVVQIASWRLMCRRGFDPNTAGDAVLRMGYEDAIAMLKRIANDQATFDVTQTEPGHEQPQVITSPSRGYAPGYGPLGSNDGGL
jgi:phage gp36-like protein